jgi:hypothetical protein
VLCFAAWQEPATSDEMKPGEAGPERSGPELARAGNRGALPWKVTPKVSTTDGPSDVLSSFQRMSDNARWTNPREARDLNDSLPIQERSAAATVRRPSGLTTQLRDDPAAPCGAAYLTEELVMTPLRRRMIEDMQIRNLAPRTQVSYVEQVDRFARHFGKSPERLGPPEIRAWQLYLARDKGLAASSISLAIAALRFLYTVTLHREWTIKDDIPICRKPHQLPEVLGPERRLPLCWMR